MVLIAPSILSADFTKLGEEIKTIENAGADLIHIDVMDGRFVPNITMGPVVLKNLKKISTLPLDAHLMIVEPEKYIDSFAELGVTYLTVHYEATNHLDRLLNYIRSLNIKAGVSINPATPVENIFPVLELCDLVLIMSVNPGFGGQKFIPYSLKKISKLKQEINSQNCSTLIEIDGGVTEENAGSIVKAGADILVAGSTVFSSHNIPQTIINLKNAHSH